MAVQFDAKQFQQTLQHARVDSVTLFAKCHHGWSYHPTKVGRMHPTLSFDLLRRQYDACKEADIRVPIYLSAGLDNLAGQLHPEWRERDHEGRLAGASPVEAGWFLMCFHSPYLGYLCEQIEEVVELFPDCDGIFLDIVAQHHSCSEAGLNVMREQGLDATREADRRRANSLALDRYYRRTTDSIRRDNPNRRVFHNSGHITRGQTEVLRHFSHLELESLPTGGWGYDHFPLSAKYAKQIVSHDVLGMTGKFHTTWGEFGGYKSLNALRYECSAMLAYGAKCSIGDQLPPHGRLDESTYRLIGKAYAEVEAKEPWCDHVQSISDIALLSAEACKAIDPGHGRDACAPDTGAVRALLEGHYLFDVIDAEMDFEPYRLLILPDEIRLGPKLEEKLRNYVDRGGRLLLSGESGLRADGSGFGLELGAEHHGPSAFSPDFAVPIEPLRPAYVSDPMVMYLGSQRITPAAGESLGEVYDPYYNRTAEHFCSHQHAPPRPEASGYALGVEHGRTLYLAHRVFSAYAAYGAVPLREFLHAAIDRALGGPRSVEVQNIPTTGRVTFMHQPTKKRSVLHLIYANTINRGGVGRQAVEVVDDLTPLHDVRVSIQPPHPVACVKLEPQGEPLETHRDGNRLVCEIPTLQCHQMVVFEQA
ncbi:alpha-amylase family protein [Phycisphaerales bacterium AB-hyl4]|uniref:Alpha-amylase family protein n=1 Tax=Natronomicrosphaera hydrolytica TaxID=3242702 RepID=A0ABV4U595_9BACT